MADNGSSQSDNSSSENGFIDMDEQMQEVPMLWNDTDVVLGSPPVASRITRMNNGSNNNNNNPSLPPGYPFGPPPSPPSDPVDPNLNLSSIGGLPSQVSYIQNNILYTITQQKALKEDWGYEPEKGIIFYGPPGTGKTLLAKALAGEVKSKGMNISFFLRKGTDCFNKYVGETEKNIRDLFAAAKAQSPSIIFFDELDGLAPHRNDGQHQFYTSVVSTLLTEIDGVQRGEVFLIGATNRLDKIDPALRRPGRFGKQLAFSPPNKDGRADILRIHLAKWKRKPTADEIDFIATQTTGFTGADLEQLCRHAFDCARERLQGTPLPNLVVAHEDWKLAISTTQKTNTNVFGNAQFVGQDLRPGLVPLLGGIRDELQENLKKYYAAGTPNMDEFVFKVMHVSTDSIDVGILNSHIIPAVLATLDPEKIPSFSISSSSTELLYNPVSYVNQVFNQIGSCFKENIILYIPRFDFFWRGLNSQAREAFRLQYELFLNKRIILLTTGTCDLQEASQGISWIGPNVPLQQSFTLRKPNSSEIDNLFRPIFSESSQQFIKQPKAAKRLDLAGSLKDVCSILHQKPIKDILALHGTMALACNKINQISRPTEQQIEAYYDELDEAITEYENRQGAGARH